MARGRDPAAVAKKWSDRLASAGPDMIAGVQGVQTAPSQDAVAKQDTMRARLLASIDSGKWASNLGKVTLQQWQQSMLSKAVPRVTQAAATAQPKMQAFLQQFLPFARQVSDQIRSMPNATDADREARMLANVRAMRTFRKS